MFGKVRLRSAAFRIEEEKLYAAVAAELSAGERREGLWAKALVNAGGDEAKASANYLKIRVQSLRDEGLVQSLAEGLVEKGVRSRDDQSPLTIESSETERPSLEPNLRTSEPEDMTADPSGSLFLIAWVSVMVIILLALFVAQF